MTLRRCLVCETDFVPNTHRHIYCTVACWEKAGGKRLNDVSDLDERCCLYCGHSFMPQNRFHRYCGPMCLNASGEERMVIDVASGKEQSKKRALAAGFSEQQFEWRWTELTIDDRFRKQDLPA